MICKLMKRNYKTTYSYGKTLGRGDFLIAGCSNQNDKFHRKCDLQNTQF